MKRFLIPALAAGLLAAPAFGAVVIVYDKDLGEEFAVEREIVDIVQQEYGEAAVYSTGDNLPEALDAALTPKSPLPATPAVEPVPEEIADKLPHTAEGTRWVKLGDHLVELDENDVIVMTVYDVLP